MTEAEDKSARKNAKHKASMEKQKSNVDASIEAADTERGVAMDTFYIERINSRETSNPKNLLELREKLNAIVHE